MKNSLDGIHRRFDIAEGNISKLDMAIQAIQNAEVKKTKSHSKIRKYLSLNEGENNISFVGYSLYSEEET